MENFKIREDLNSIVSDIKFKSNKTNYGIRNVCNVILFNDKVIEFRDTDNLYELFQSYVDIGETDFIKSKELVEEYKKNAEGEIEGTYICVKYTLKDGSVYRLFATKCNSNKMIDNYYKFYKQQKKSENKK